MARIEESAVVQPLLRNPVLKTLLVLAPTTECHLVGGVLRDHFLGCSSRDFDIVVATGGRRLAERLAERLKARLVILGANRFTSFRLVHGDYILDLWDRDEMSLFEDLARRDFTVNSLALDLRTGGLLDPFNGLGDLKSRLLRCTSERSFPEDPLRVLRLVRFVAQLPGFSIDPHTLEAARRYAKELEQVPRERTREELDTILRQQDVVGAVEILVTLRLFPGLWLGAPGQALGPGDGPARLRLLLAWLEELEELLPDAGDPADRQVCVHSTLIDSAAALGGQSPPTLCSSLRSRGLLTSRLCRRAVKLLSLSELPSRPEEERSFLADWGARWIDAVGFWGGKALIDRDRSDLLSCLERLTSLIESHPEVLNPTPFLSGHEVKMLLQIGPGPAVGRALRDLLRAQIAGGVKTREEAEHFLSERASRYRPVNGSPTATSYR